MVFTPSKEQEPAINDRQKDILVSASAGSGKTAVLVERVIQLMETGLSKDAKPSERPNIDDILMVTFTTDAAKNMRDRIRRRLVGATDEHMKAQVARLALANISTIHSFCEQLIKRYYYVIDLDPQFRLIDDAEQQLLKEQAWQVTLDDWVANPDQVGALHQLIDNFGAGNLESVVQALDTEADAQPHPSDWLAGLSGLYQFEEGADPRQSAFFKRLLEPLVGPQLKELRDQWAALGEVGPARFAEQVEEDLAKLATTVDDQGHLLGSWDSLAQTLNKKNFAPKLRKRKDDDDPELLDELGVQRGGLRDQLGDLHDTYFFQSAADLVKYSQKAGTLIEILTRVATDFRCHYQIIKQDRRLLDFSDLEHYAYAILTGENINPKVTWSDEEERVKRQAAAQVQAELQRHYKEIMIDEYQDTNRLQDDLLRLLHKSGQNHRFMVGDMKQSIYRFRQADPTLFKDYYDQFSADGQRSEALDLSDNYRSRHEVTDLVNLIFEQLMDQQLGEMVYDDKASLKPKADWGADRDQASPATPELLLFDGGVKKTTANPTGEDAIVVRQPEDKVASEVWLIGQRIRELLAKETILDPETKRVRPITPGDIAILSRAKRIHSVIAEQFAKLNLPVMVHGVENYFKATEIRVVMSLLKVIDNPYQDIPLAAVLRSPLIQVAPEVAAKFGLSQGENRIGFTEPELAYLKVNSTSKDFFGVVQQNYYAWRDQEVEAVENHDALTEEELAERVAGDPAGLATKEELGVNCGLIYLKLARFFELRDHLRRVAQRRPLVDLIWTIYQATGYLDYVGGMSGGPQRQANLHALYERASGYEESGFKGLYQFIHFIEQMQKKNDDLGEATTALAGDAINVMTIHKSKGLQFPIVFLVETTHQFPADRDPVTIEPQAGLGFTYVDSTANETMRVKHPLVQQAALKEKKKRQDRAEEMRLLYVALTRAEQRLFITGYVKDADLTKKMDKWNRAFDSASPLLTTTTRLKGQSMLDWIMMTLVRTANFPTLREGVEAAATPLRGLTKAAYQIKLQNADQVQAALNTLLDLHPNATAEQATPAAATSRQFKADLERVLNFTYPDQVATQTTAFQAVSTLREAFARQDPTNLEMGRLEIDRDQIKEAGAYLAPEERAFENPAFITGASDQEPTGTAIGTATHLVFQKLPLTEPLDEGAVRALIKSLTESGLIDNPQVAAGIDVAGVVSFYQTGLGQVITAHPEQVHREVPFSMLLSAHELFSGIGAADDSEVLIHGIIDGYVQHDDQIDLFDYKTDRISQAHPEEDLRELSDKYSGQLVLYADALTKMTGIPLEKIHRHLYFTRAKRVVTLSASPSSQQPKEEA